MACCTFNLPTRLAVMAIGWALATGALGAERVLVEAESFDDLGGWKLDTQFIHSMGSPYLLAHGLGRSVSDATTEASFPAPGVYYVFVRTKNWVGPWDAPGAPGKFEVLVDGQPIDHTFGAAGKEWLWEPGGKVAIRGTKAQLALRDLTGFDGRCDAIYFASENVPPPNDSAVLAR